MHSTKTSRAAALHCLSCATLLLCCSGAVSGQRQRDGLTVASTGAQRGATTAGTTRPNAFVPGLKKCTPKENRTAACLAGECASLQTSSLHTYVMCRCPVDRTGKRCEERSVSHDVITWMAKRLAALPPRVRCQSRNVDILVKQGFESSFIECIKYQNSKKAKVKDRSGQASTKRLRSTSAPGGATANTRTKAVRSTSRLAALLSTRRIAL